MITEYDLQEAIAECQGQKNPTSNTCIKLAAYYTIYDHLFPKNNPDDTPVPVLDMRSSGYSGTIAYDGDSEFAEAVNGKDTSHVMEVLDELMLTLQALNPRLYTGVMKKL